jgi:WhiB family redox-sensing transcriptional regulator
MSLAHLQTSPLGRVFDDQPWRLEAACRGMDTRWFFPQRGESVREQYAVCNECPVKAPCLEYALQNKETSGIWGGTGERQRRRMRATMAMPRRKRGPGRITGKQHGSEYAYKFCGPPKCEACKLARREAAIRRGELTGNGYTRTGERAEQ